MIIKFLKKEITLSVFLFLLGILSVLYPGKIIKYPSLIDWKTLIALSGLLIITTGIKESGYFLIFAKKLLKKIKNEKTLSFFLIILSLLLSTFLTNDITLFIIVPLTVSVQSIIKNHKNYIVKLVIFEAIAVNVGSALTPIGNPQNLFLWHKWQISFLNFIIKMFPLVTVLFLIILIFAWFVFPNRKIIFFKNEFSEKIDKRLFALSIILLIIYMFALDMGYANFFLPLIFIIFFLFYIKVLLKVDWLLLLLFAVIFIDFQIISNIDNIVKIVSGIDLQTNGDIFLFSAFLSQFCSNMPSSIFMSNFSNNWQSITYGVNVGGNGLVVASLANIIALRIINTKKIWLEFHKYSIFYLVITIIVTYILFYL